MARTSEFETSKPLVNQLQHNIVWGQKGNFLDVPDRLPAARRAAGLDGRRPGLLSHRRLQHGRGRLLHQVAEGRGRRPVRERQRAPRGAQRAAATSRAATPGGAAGWADAATIIPWNMYLAYGDKRVLETQYDSMVALGGVREDARRRRLHLGRRLPLRRLARLRLGGHGGERLSRARPRARTSSPPPSSRTPPTCCSATALVLGKKDDAARYARAAREDQGRLPPGVRDRRPAAWARAPRPPTRSPCSSTSCPRSCGRRRRSGWPRTCATRKHLTTGFLGTPYLCHVLEPLRLPGRGLPAAQPRGVPVVALPGEAGRDHDLGALGRPEARRLVPDRRR